MCVFLFVCLFVCVCVSARAYLGQRSMPVKANPEGERLKRREREDTVSAVESNTTNSQR